MRHAHGPLPFGSFVDGFDDLIAPLLWEWYNKPQNQGRNPVRFWTAFRLIGGRDLQIQTEGGVPLEDSQLIELFWQKNPEAVSETAGKYGAYCFAIARRILHSPEDCEECINDVWLRAWNAIPPQRPGVLRLFLGRITRNLAFDRLQGQKAEKRGGGEITLVLDELEECLGGGSDAAAEYEAKELRECIRRFVEALPEREGNVLVRRYFFAEPVADIARRYGLTENHVMVMLSRTRKKLKAHLLKEGYR